VKKPNLILIGGLIIVVCFFLPWVKACGVKVSGYQLASDEDVGDPIFWLVFISGICIVGAFFIAKKPKPIVIMSAIIGALIMLVKFFSLITRGEGRELGLSLETGGYGTIIGLLLAFIGALSDKNVSEKPEVKPVSVEIDRENASPEEKK